MSLQTRNLCNILLYLVWTNIYANYLYFDRRILCKMMIFMEVTGLYKKNHYISLYILVSIVQNQINSYWAISKKYRSLCRNFRVLQFLFKFLLYLEE